MRPGRSRKGCQGYARVNRGQSERHCGWLECGQPGRHGGLGQRDDPASTARLRDQEQAQRKHWATRRGAQVRRACRKRHGRGQHGQRAAANLLGWSCATQLADGRRDRPPTWFRLELHHNAERRKGAARRGRRTRTSGCKTRAVRGAGCCRQQKETVPERDV